MFAGEIRKRKALYAVVDALALMVAFAGALALHDPEGALVNRMAAASPLLLLVGAMALAFAWVLVFHAFDLYRFRNGGLDENIAVAKACTVAFALSLGLEFFAHLDLSRLSLLSGYLMSVPFVMIGRAALRRVIRRLYADPKITIPLVIVGFNPIGQYLCDQILDDLNQYEFLGFVDDGELDRAYRGYGVLGTIDQLGGIAAEQPSVEAAIALPDAPLERHQQVIALCEQHRIQWRLVPWLFRSLSAGFKVDMAGIIPLIGPRSCNIEGLNYVIKRGFDITIASMVLILAAPLMLLAALLIWITDGRPILFRQKRVGLHGRSFEFLKFRTMHNDAGDQVHREYVKDWIQKNGSSAQTNGNGEKVFKLTCDPRITPLGRWLRRFSIDELPQIINVLRGEMSLIGPRPALPYELELYRDWHRRRLDAPPGITGLWQVGGRNQLGFDDMVRLDIEYLEGWTLAGDLRILARTLPALFHGRGY